MESFININEKLLKEYCDKGLKGDYRIAPKEISFPLTNVCNNYCIMCHVCSKNYENHTYDNELPYHITLEQYKKIVTPPKKTLWEKIIGEKKVYLTDLSFVFGTAETLINPHLYDIVKYTKEIYPNCKIRLISNGTIPPKRDIVKYIDRIGFSIDGCKKETFEKLRPPAKFSKVLDCIKKWDDSAEEYNKSFSFGFATVVSSANIDELEGILRLAKTYKHIDSVYIQPIILHETKSYLDELLLKHIPQEARLEYIDNLTKLSEELGLRIDNLNSIASPYIEENNQEKESDLSYRNSKYCRYAWNKIISFTENGDFRYFCCYIEKNKMDELLNKYRVPKNVSIEDAYNSKAFWQFRKDMIDGKLLEYCKGCSLGNSSYKILCERKIDICEDFYV